MALIDIQTQGLAQAQDLLATLKKMGAKPRSVDLHGKQRLEGNDANNAEVLGWLKNTGRDFITPTKEMMDEIGEALKNEIEEGLIKAKARRAARAVTASAKQTPYKPKGDDQLAKSVMNRALKNAMFKAMKIMSDRINNQETADGVLTELTEKYAAYKQKKFGFTRPIGKATGQLIDNLAQSARNIKLRRG